MQKETGGYANGTSHNMIADIDIDMRCCGRIPSTPAPVEQLFQFLVVSHI